MSGHQYPSMITMESNVPKENVSPEARPNGFRIVLLTEYRKRPTQHTPADSLRQRASLIHLLFIDAGEARKCYQHPAIVSSNQGNTAVDNPGHTAKLQVDKVQVKDVGHPFSYIPAGSCTQCTYIVPGTATPQHYQHAAYGYTHPQLVG